jgi:hypothetical protein
MIMSRYKWIFTVLLLLLVSGAAYTWFFVWNQPQKNIQNATALEISAADLFTLYQADEKKANTQFIDKVLQVRGEVSSISKNTEGNMIVMLKTSDPMFGVNCTMEQSGITIDTGTTVTLKGICSGYLTDVVLIRCYKIN